MERVRGQKSIKTKTATWNHTRPSPRSIPHTKMLLRFLRVRWSSRVAFNNLVSFKWSNCTMQSESTEINSLRVGWVSSLRTCTQEIKKWALSAFTLFCLSNVSKCTTCAWWVFPRESYHYWNQLHITTSVQQMLLRATCFQGPQTSKTKIKKWDLLGPTSTMHEWLLLWQYP